MHARARDRSVGGLALRLGLALVVGATACEGDSGDGGTTTEAEICGNGVCGVGESPQSCPADCLCGNGACDTGESPQSCPADCPCGNGAIDSGEDCDDADLGGADCLGLGAEGGDLACGPACRFDLSGCTTRSVTVHPANVVGENALSLGFQVDGPDIVYWRDSATAQQLATDAGFTLVRFFEHRMGKPCSSWNEASHSCSSWDWSDIDELVGNIFAVGAEPLVVLGFYSWTQNTLSSAPTGMASDPVTGLPDPAQWGAYCRAWVAHFADAGFPVQYYEIINEPFHYFGWPATEPELGYFLDLYEAAADAMRAENPNVKLGNDASLMKSVLDGLLAHGEDLGFLSYHGYGVGDLAATDQEIIDTAETKYVDESSSVYGIDLARQTYEQARGVVLPVMKTEDNINYVYEPSADPRTPQMLGAIYTALSIRTLVLHDVSYRVYFHFASNAESNPLAPGFGMVNSQDDEPWYPYYVQKMISTALSVGDPLVETSSGSDDIRILGWTHQGTLRLLLINRTTELRSALVTGVSGSFAFSKVDQSIPWETPEVQTGTVDAALPIPLQGYGVALLELQPR